MFTISPGASSSEVSPSPPASTAAGAAAACTEIPGRACLWRGLPAYCGPVGLVGQYDSIYRQQEDGTFRDVSVEVGMVPKAPKYAFTSYWFDYDDDGLLDLYVANDSEENFLWKQTRDKDGKIRFRDVAEELVVGVHKAFVNEIMALDAGERDFFDRYSRHLLLPQVGEAGQRRLQHSRVLVVGAGGLGAPAAF